MPDPLKVINQLRKDIADLQTEKSRLEGRLESKQNTLDELTKKCEEKFDCSVDELPEVVSKLRKEANEKVEEAKKILGIDEGDDE